MKIHIVCPFWRVYLIPTLIHYLEPMRIEWYPVVAPKEDVPFDRDWIHPIKVAELSKTDKTSRKLNDFIDTQQIVDDDYYGFMNDDDMYEPGFFDVIRAQTANIIMCSMYRGDTVPYNDGVAPHPAYSLIINKLSDIRIGNIGVEQYILKGSILKQTRFGNKFGEDDGIFAMYLRDHFPNDILFLPDLFVFFNYFQPKRYTNTSKFLKPTWSLPVIFV